MKHFVKIFAIFSIVIFSTFYTINNQLNAKTINDLYSELSKLESEVKNTDSNLSQTKSNIESHKAAIASATNDIENKESEINQNQVEINDLEDAKAKKQEEIKELLVYYQTNNLVNDELSFVVNADSITDSIHRETTVGILTEKSGNKIEEFIGIQTELTQKNTELTSDIEELEQMQIAFEKEIAEFEITVNDLTEYKVGAADKVKDMKNTIKYYEDLGCKKTEDLEACKQRTSTVVPNTSGFTSPMDNGYITSEFGWRWGSHHAGIDMSGGNGIIYASAPGIVGAVGYDGSRGYYAYVHHTINGQRYSTAYFHLASSAYVGMGQQVNTSTQIGVMGNTGNSTGAHLHFEILVDWYGLTGYNASLARNPRNFLSYPAVGVYWSGRNR